MEKDFKFAVEDIQRLNVEEYDENEYCVARMKFLSTRPNSHGLKFSEKVLKRDAKTVLGTWIVAEMLAGDFLTHTPAESIIGIVPKDQDVEFAEADDGYIDAYVDVVLSKRYAKDAYDVFVKDNNRSVSIEFNYFHPEDDEYEVESYVIRGTTILGKTVNPSVPKANITVTRFSEEEADKFFAKVHNNSLTVLKKFVEERKESMAEGKTYKIDKSKDAMSETPWGEIDKTELRNKIMEAKNKAILVKAVYMLVEDGWEEAPSEHLKYPVMCFEDNTLVYNKGGLSSALGYAKKENETTVINKINKIYKNLGLNQDGKEDDAKMAEIEFAAVDLGDMWGRLYDAINKRQGWEYCICGIYEQDNKKFAILKDRDKDQYRLDFSLTEEGLTIADEIVRVQTEFIETDDIKKFAEPEDAEKYKKFEDDDSDDDDDEDDDKSDDDKDDELKEEKMSEEDMMAKISELQKSVEDRDNIIMEKDKKMGEMEAELSELREYKAACEKKELATSVESIMAEVKDCMSEDKYKEFRDEGLTCKMSELDAWSNKVKAFCFENGKVSKTTKKNDIFSFAAPAENNQKPMNVWDRLKNL